MTEHRYLVTVDELGEMTRIDEVGEFGELNRLDVDQLHADGSVVVIRNERRKKPKVSLPGIILGGSASVPSHTSN